MARSWDLGRLLAVMVVGLASAACTINNSGDNDGGYGGSDGLSGCERVCDQLDRCDRCLEDGDGQCLTEADCVYNCERDSSGWSGCLDETLSTGYCYDDAIDACLAGDDTDDTCGKACAVLDDCGQCGPTDDQSCPSVTECAESCRAEGDPAWATCVQALTTCGEDEIGACFEDVGDDACALGCQALETCELCETDDNDECLTVADCADQCRTNDNQTWGQCLADVTSCDGTAIQACYDALDEDPGTDACALGCKALDDCGFCEVDSEEECLSITECAEQCRTDANEVWGQCLAEVQACGETAIDACYAGEVVDPGTDACAMGCKALDACELCDTDDNDECLSMVACAERCRTEGNETWAQCLSAVEACGEEAISACYEATPVETEDDFDRACTLILGCDFCLATPEAPEACLAQDACASYLRDGAAVEQTTCFLAIDACDEQAYATCQGTAEG